MTTKLYFSLPKGKKTEIGMLGGRGERQNRACTRQSYTCIITQCKEVVKIKDMIDQVYSFWCSIKFCCLLKEKETHGRKKGKFKFFWIEARNLIILVTRYIKRTKHKTNNNFLLTSRASEAPNVREASPSPSHPSPIFSLMDDECSFSLMAKFFHENQNKLKYIAKFVFLGMI